VRVAAGMIDAHAGGLGSLSMGGTLEQQNACIVLWICETMACAPETHQIKNLCMKFSFDT
jgi:hypothetical protein